MTDGPAWDPNAKYSVAVDFDGVIHSYTSKWIDAETIPDPPVPGVIDWLNEIANDYQVIIFTTRAKESSGSAAVARWLRTHGFNGNDGTIFCTAVKPPALVYIGRWMVRFRGDFGELMPLEQSDKALALKAKREGPEPEFTDAEWGYVGGIIDGEGSFLGRKNDKGKAYVALDVTNQHVAVLEWLQKKVGGSIYQQKPVDDDHFPVYHWNLPGARMAPLLRGLLQRGCLRMKSQQAEWSLEYLSLCRYDGRPAREIDLVRKEQLQKAVTDMNRYGQAVIDPIVIDDRAFRFNGNAADLPSARDIRYRLVPWNKGPSRGG